MQIVTTKTTVGNLLIQLSGLDATEEVTFTSKAARAPGPCWCGCGRMTKAKFVPGHDSTFHSRAKRVARGELQLDLELARLPHAEARAEFQRCVEVEEPKHKARLDAEAAKKAAKAEKAAKAAAATVESSEPVPAIAG